MNPYMMDIGVEDDDERYITAPERVRETQPIEAPEPVEVPAEPVTV